MKKWITVTALTLTAALTCTGCSLFSDESIVKFSDEYTHKDPENLKYDERIVLKGDNFESRLEDEINQAAYPDNVMYDDDGNMIGIYDYDAETGLAKGWTNITDGTYTAYEEGEEVDLGKPDESLMIDIPGSVTAGFVVYGNKDEAVDTYLYLFLTDAAAKDTVETSMESLYGLTMTEESDTVLTCVQDQDYMNEQFDMEEEYGTTIDKRNAQAYAEVLKMMYGVREYGGENPYKPYADHKDPEDLEYDEKVVLTGSGEAAVEEKYAEDISSMTDYVYGYKGDVVAHYAYFECPSKEAADTLINEVYTDATRVSDTVILRVEDGQELQDVITAYMGYNVLKDRSVDEYVRMLQETFYSSVYE